MQSSLMALIFTNAMVAKCFVTSVGKRSDRIQTEIAMISLISVKHGFSITVGFASITFMGLSGFPNGILNHFTLMQ